MFFSIALQKFSGGKSIDRGFACVDSSEFASNGFGFVVSSEVIGVCSSGFVLAVGRAVERVWM